MSRVVSVSRRATHLIELQRQGFEVLDLPSGSVPREQDMDDTTAVLLDVGDLEKTASTVRAIRTLDPTVPVVVLGGSEEDWTALESDGHTLVVVPPVSFEQVAAALRSLDPPSPSTVSVETVLEAVTLGAPEVGQSDTDQADASDEPSDRESADASERAKFPVVDQPVSKDAAGPPADASVRTAGPTTGAPIQRRLNQILARGAHRSATVTAAGEGQDWRDAAGLVLNAVADLPSPAEASDSLAHALLDVVAADAVAILVSDDDRWRVSGGVGVRPIETRLTLAAEDWLISELQLGLPVVAIPDTDARRAELAFTPLARQTSLLGALLSDSQVLAIVGRNSAPFESDEVADVLECLRRRVCALTEALDARDVARRLARFL